MLSKVREDFSLPGKASRMPEFGMPRQWSTLLAQYQDMICCFVKSALQSLAGQQIGSPLMGMPSITSARQKACLISAFATLNPQFGAVWQKEG